MGVGGGCQGLALTDSHGDVLGQFTAEGTAMRIVPTAKAMALLVNPADRALAMAQSREGGVGGPPARA